MSSTTTKFCPFSLKKFIQDAKFQQKKWGQLQKKAACQHFFFKIAIAIYLAGNRGLKKL